MKWFPQPTLNFHLHLSLRKRSERKITDFGKNDAEILWTERRLKEEKERKEVERGNNESMPNSENLVENSVRGR